MLEFFAVFSPLVAFIIAGLLGKKIGDEGAMFITCAGVILAAISSVILFFDVIVGMDPRVVQILLAQHPRGVGAQGSAGRQKAKSSRRSCAASKAGMPRRRAVAGA